MQFEGQSERYERALGLLVQADDLVQAKDAASAALSTAADLRTQARELLEALHAEGYEYAGSVLLSLLRQTVDSAPAMVRALAFAQELLAGGPDRFDVLYQSGKLYQELGRSESRELLTRARYQADSDKNRAATDLLLAHYLEDLSARYQEWLRLRDSSPLACAFAAQDLAYGSGVARDVGSAESLAKQAVARGEPFGHIVLAELARMQAWEEMGRKQGGAATDAKQSGWRDRILAHYEVAARVGYVDAEIWIADSLLGTAWLARDGERMPDSPELKRARAYLERGMAFENKDAFFFWGHMQRLGIGVTKDPLRGIKRIQEAAERGCREAYACLAGIYARGDDVPFAPATARRWAVAAETAGDGDIRSAVETILRRHPWRLRLATYLRERRAHRRSRHS
ncbi:MAG: hypothetical protein AB8H80_04785 [Planctomycetota bacterium]